MGLRLTNPTQRRLVFLLSMSSSAPTAADAGESAAMPGAINGAPTLAEGLKSLLVCVNTDFKTPNFAAGVQRAFVRVGLMKKSDGTYTTCNAHHKAGGSSQVFHLKELCTLRLAAVTT